MERTSRFFRGVAILVSGVLVLNLFQLPQLGGVAWASEEHEKDVGALGVAPVTTADLRASAPQSHLPVEFGDLQSFHDQLVAEAEGYFQISYQDIAIPGPGPQLQVKRIYNSHVDRESAFGLGWNWTYGVRLGEDEETGEPVIVDVNNRLVHFAEYGGEYRSVNTAQEQRLEISGSAYAVRIFADDSKQYFENGRLRTVEDARGRRLELRYQGEKLVEAVDATGRFLRFSYSGPYITRIVDPLGREWRYEYAGGLLRNAYDPLGRRTEFVYLPKFLWRQRMSHVRFPNGADMKITYHPLNKRVRRIEGPGSLDTRFKFRVNPHRLTMRQWLTDARDHTSRIRFEAVGLKAEEGEGGAEAGLLYMDREDIRSIRYRDNVIELRDAEGGKREISSGSTGLVVKDEMGRAAMVRKDADGRVVHIRDAEGNESALDYGADGQIRRVDLPSGGSISLEHEGGELRAVTNALGNTTRFDPLDDGHGGVRITDPTGVETVLTKDVYGFPEVVRDAAGGERRFSYDEVGRLLAATDPHGGTWRYTYDAANNLTAVKDPRGAEARMEYDEMDNLVRVVDPMGRETRMRYIALGLLSEARHSGGQRVRNEYDATGNLIASHQLKEGREISTRFAYDRNNRLVRVEDSAGHVYESGYDPSGFLTSFTNPKGARVNFQPDALGRTRLEMHPDGSRIRRKYGPGFEVESVSYTDLDGAESRVSFDYDMASRLKAIDYGGETEQFAYDAAGRLLEVHSAASRYVYEYDEAGRVVAIRDESREADNELRFEYDRGGRVTALVEPGGVRREYGYDQAGNLRSVDVEGLGTIETSLDLGGSPDRIRFPNGVHAEFTYDDGGRVASIAYRDGSGSVVASFEQTYDEAGSVLSVEGAGRTVRYEYDDAFRLIRATRKGQSAEQYAYDGAGNLTRIGPWGPEDLEYDRADKLVRAGDVRFRYDERGNLVERSDGTRYRYDGDGRLVRIDFADGGYAAYTYDAMGRRVQKDVDGRITRYVYDGLNLLAEYDGRGRLRARYVHGPGVDNWLAVWRDGQWYYFVKDHGGTVRGLLDAKGMLLEWYRYTDYGLPVDGHSSIHNLGLAGREYDPESGLYFFRSRFYDPRVGRFIQRDRIGLTGGLNLYAYAEGDPVNNRDPLGLDVGFNLSGTLAEVRNDFDWLIDWVKEVKSATDWVRKPGWRIYKGLQYRELVQAMNRTRGIAKLEQVRYVRYTGNLARSTSPFGRGAIRELVKYQNVKAGLWARRAFRAEGAVQRFRVMNALGYAAFYYEAFRFFQEPSLERLKGLELSALSLVIGFGIMFGGWPVLIALGAGVAIAAAIILGVLLYAAIRNDDPTFIQPPSPSPPLSAMRARPSEPAPAKGGDDRSVAREPDRAASEPAAGERPLVIQGLETDLRVEALEPEDSQVQSLATADVKPAWVDGRLPGGARSLGEWQWGQGPSYGGSASHTGPRGEDGPSLHYFIQAGEPLVLDPHDNLVQYVYLDAEDPPSEILVQLYTEGEKGEHRVFWGEHLIDLAGKLGTGSLARMGPLPETGRWVRLKVPVERFGLERAEVTGALFGQYGGQAHWGPTTKSLGHLDRLPDILAVAPAAGDDLDYEVEAEVSFTLSADARTRVWAENRAGERVAELVDRILGAGSHRALWDGRGADGGLAPEGGYGFVVESQALPGVARDAQAMQAEAPFELSTLVARIEIPAPNSLVARHVPVFGTAAGRGFDRYELARGSGADPDEWRVVVESRNPQVMNEPPLAEAFAHSRTVSGNLGSFAPAGSESRISLRLRVWNRAGGMAEDRVTLWRGDVVPNNRGGVVAALDGRFEVHVPALAMPRSFHLFSASPVATDLRPRLEADAESIGATILAGPYEVRPAGIRLAVPATLEVAPAGEAPPGSQRHIGVYAYEPGAGSWRRLQPASPESPQSEPGATLRATLAGGLPSGRAIFAVMADGGTRPPVLLEPAEVDRRTRLLGVAEPGARVTLSRVDEPGSPGSGGDAEPVDTVVADASGLVVFPAVYLHDGRNHFIAHAQDAAGNQAASEQALEIAYEPRAPVSLASAEVEQQGDVLLIRATPADGAHSREGRAEVRVASGSDPEGFLLILEESPANAGRLEGRIGLDAQTDPHRRVLRLERNGERVSVSSGGRELSAFDVQDLVAPPAPVIASDTHPVRSPPRDRASAGAEVLGRTATRSFLRDPLDLRRYPVLTFNYRVEPGSTLHLLWNVNGIWYGATLAGERFPGRGKVVSEGLGRRAFALIDDGEWHQAHLNLFERPRAHQRRADAFVAEQVLLGAWRRTGYSALSPAFTKNTRIGYQIADVRFHAAAGPPALKVAWEDPADLSGISDYSYRLDRRADTIPPPEGMGKINEIALEPEDGDGVYYFHVRARDGAGNWGATAHFPLGVDTTAPSASDPSPAPASRSAELVVGIGISDGPNGSGVDPDTVRIRVDGTAYDLTSPALTYDTASERLRFEPWKTDPPLAAWPDGKRVAVRLEAAADYAGNALQEPVAWHFVVDASSAAGGDARMLTQEGGVEPSWSPDGERLAYVVQNGTDRTLWIMDVGSATVRSLPVPLEDIATPAWSPDGARIAFSASGEEGRGDVYVVSPEDGTTRNLTQSAEHESDPVWSPAGESLLFVRHGDLWEMAADGRGVRVLYDDPDGAEVRRPRPSKDGSSVLFWRSLYDEQVWRYDLGGSTAKPVIATGQAVDPDWGPEGGQIVYAAQTGSARLQSLVPGGGSPRLLVANEGWWDRYPRVSPDGTRMVYQSTRNGFWNLWLLEWLSLGPFSVEPERFRYPEPVSAPPQAELGVIPAPPPGETGIRIAYDAQGFAGGEIQVLDPEDRVILRQELAPDDLTEPGALMWSGYAPGGEPLAAGPYLVRILAYPPDGGDPVTRGVTVTFSEEAAATAPEVAPQATRYPTWLLGLVAVVMLAFLGLVLVWIRRRSEKG